MWSGTTPALVLLDVLSKAGWQHGQAPEEHTLGSPKRLRLGEMVTSKATSAAWSFLEDLVLRGLRALRPGQPPKYYACVLRSPLPGEAPLGLGAAA